MALLPMTERQKSLIINNVLAACKDISKLKPNGYKFVMLSSGFIAHYNLYGFQDHYSQPGALAEALLRNEPSNWWDNFRPGEQNYEYYHQKGEIYAEICRRLK